MIRKIFVAATLAVAVGTAAVSFSATQAEAKCKFGCGLAIGLGAGIVGSAIVNDARRGDRGYDEDYYGRPRYTCRSVSYDCADRWGYDTRRYYRCLRRNGC